MMPSASQLHHLGKKKPATRGKALRYHERASFLRNESSFDVDLGSCVHGAKPPPPAPWFLGKDVSESYRLAATVSRSAQAAAFQTRPFSWGYGSNDGALGHNNTKRVEAMTMIAAFRHDVVRSVSAGNRLSLFLTGWLAPTLRAIRNVAMTDQLEIHFFLGCC